MGDDDASSSSLDLVVLSAPLAIGPIRLFLLATLAGHGASDLALKGRRPYETYVVVCIFLGLVPELILNIVFITMSAIHFAEDIGPVGSVALHAAVGVTSMIVSREAGIDIVLVYMCVFHVPLHFILLNDSHEDVAIVVALVFMFVLGMVAIVCPEVLLVVPVNACEEECWLVSFCPLVQSVVCAHILFGMTQSPPPHPVFPPVGGSQPQKKSESKL
jgi:hypothetical protein